MCTSEAQCVQVILVYKWSFSVCTSDPPASETHRNLGSMKPFSEGEPGSLGYIYIYIEILVCPPIFSKSVAFRIARLTTRFINPYCSMEYLPYIYHKIYDINVGTVNIPYTWAYECNVQKHTCFFEIAITSWSLITNDIRPCGSFLEACILETACERSSGWGNFLMYNQGLNFFVKDS